MIWRHSRSAVESVVGFFVGAQSINYHMPSARHRDEKKRAAIRQPVEVVTHRLLMHTPS